MAKVSKTPKKGLSLPEHYDPSVDKLRENMTLIDSLLQRANPNDLSSVNDGESNINTLTTTGRYLVKSSATGCPIPGYAGVVDVFRAGTYILQEWRSINSSNYTYRRYITSTGSSWSNWIKDWNANNDGSGSGLDADTIDGLDSTAFSRIYNRTVTDFNKATYIGFWCINGSTNAPNNSESLWGCIVFSTDISGSSISSTWLCQIAIPDNTGGNTLYYRKKYGSSWGSWHTIWSTGSDGSNSGLDADKLDGYQASAFVLLSKLEKLVREYTYIVDGGATSDEALNVSTLPTGTYYVSSGWVIPYEGADTVSSPVTVTVVNNAENPDYSANFVTVSKYDGIKYYWVDTTDPTKATEATYTTGKSGAGSGHDADKLDGIESTGFARYQPITQKSSNSSALNSLVTSGIYGVRISSSAYVTGSPTGSTGRFSVTVIVGESSNYVTQTAIDLSTGKVYVRNRNGSATWGSWSEITPKIPVLSTDPTSPSEGQMWILSS